VLGPMKWASTSARMGGEHVWNGRRREAVEYVYACRVRHLWGAVAAFGGVCGYASICFRGDEVLHVFFWTGW
jgi:hypothetical protein